ncbi:hypothetical protein D8674_007381 [Pyrus ussuriensis x Pyrus communis]|uniref:Uncharacterized protein n=1 Tax=Pyrus ussuriensis x Pyrus communis TaxID=2448454 RepID=A0A5N5HUK9_9ROSA|nr:hypothetical protein D8674_007381 [Pyrus ussuriensis x Pyrus communis]
MRIKEEEEEMAAAGGSQVVKVKREIIEACLSAVFVIRCQRRLQPFHSASIRSRPYFAKYYSQDIFPVKRKKVDAREVREHEANNPDVTPSSLGGCRFSAEEPLEIDDSAEYYPVSSCACNDLSK